ncbi:MAG: RAMP superfamily CRISPR-associated protein [Candidatus Nitrosocaldaceae archaeon]
MSFKHLEKIYNRSIIELTFDVKSPISLGLSNESNVRSIVKYIINNKIIVLIPSESIKGVMRSLGRRLIIGNESYDKLIKSCNKGKHTVNISNINDESDKLLEQIFSEEQLKDISKEDKNSFYLSVRCPLCRLFGSSNFASKLIFKDVILDTPIFTYTSNSIDRRFNIAKEDHLFRVEYVKPDSIKINIIANNLSKPESILFSRILEVISKRGLQIGGLKSKGYGLLSFKEADIKVLKLVKPTSEDDIIKNINALLLIDNFQKYEISDYLKLLESYDELLL